MIKPILMTTVLTALVACSGPTNRVEMIPLNSTLEFRANVESVIVRTVCQWLAAETCRELDYQVHCQLGSRPGPMRPCPVEGGTIRPL